MVRLNRRGEYVVPSIPLAEYTVVIDRERNRQVMIIRSVIVLPIGAEVELTDPNVNAQVVGIRLSAGDESLPPTVCLDVRVPEEYWTTSTGI
jgi:hypothetical protein